MKPKLTQTLLSLFILLLSFSTTHILYSSISKGTSILTEASNFLALIVGDAKGLKVREFRITADDSYGSIYKVYIRWSGGKKPYFLELKTNGNWNRVAENLTKSIYEYTAIDTITEGSSACFRFGYDSNTKKDQNTYVSEEFCGDIPTNLAMGDTVAYQNGVGIKVRDITLYENEDSGTYQGTVRLLGGNKPYTIEARGDYTAWKVISTDQSSKEYTGTIPPEITDGQTNFCTRVSYLKKLRSGTIRYISDPLCMDLASAIPGGDTASGEPVSKITVSRITHYNLTLRWPKYKGDPIDGYAVYREGEFVAQTTATYYTEKPILMPDTTYTYSVRIIPKGTKPPIYTLTSAEAFSAGDFSTASAKGTGIATEATTKLVPEVNLGKPVNVLVVPVAFNNVDVYPYDSPGHIKEKVITDTDSMINYYDEVSFGKIKVNADVVDHLYFVDKPKETPSFVDVIEGKMFFTELNSKLLEEGYDISKYNIIVFNFPRLIPSNLWGRVDEIGDVGGDIKGYIWINGIQDNMTYAH